MGRYDLVQLSEATIGQFCHKVELQCIHLVMLIRHSQCLRPSKHPQKALCVHEGRSDYGKSAVKILIQLYCGDRECVQTGICGAVVILRKSCKNC